MKSRKILAWLLALCMTTAMVPAALAADGDAVAPTEIPSSASDTPTADDSAKDDAAPVDDTAKDDADPADAAPADADPADAAPADADPADADPADAAPADADPTDDAAPAGADPTDGAAPADADPADDAPTDAAPADAAPVVVNKDAVLSASSVLVNGEKTAFDAYTIEGFTYFKLRDVAAALAGTPSAFDVQWNAEKFCIELTTGKDYAKAEGDLVAGNAAASVTASSTKMGMILNGASVELAGYSIDGNTYFQLRDLAEKLNFSVNWNANEKSITIDSKEAAPAEGDAAPAEGDAAPAEGDVAPAEGDAAPAEGDAAPAEGDAAPAEGDAAPAEGDAAPAE